MPSKITVSGVAEQRFQQNAIARDHELVVDEPIEYGGTDKGPTPYELLLAALAS